MQKTAYTFPERCRNVLEGHRVLFRFFFRDGAALFGEVATAWDRPTTVDAPKGVVAAPSTWLTFDRATIDGYNQRYETAKLRLRELVRNRGDFGPNYLVPLFAVRIATVIAAAFFGFWATLCTSVLQFVAAPYSFYAAVAAWWGMVPFYVMHFLTFAGLQTGTWLLGRRFPIVAHYTRIPVSLALIGVWFAVDQLTCLVLSFWSPVGKPVRVSPKRFLQSVAYGFLNAKTYWLVLLLCLRGFQVDLLALALYALMPGRVHGLGYVLWRRILPRHFLHHTFANAMFYHYHRTVHLPGPYNEGHRHHHYLPDATPFDAHMHGTGMPEEWLKLMTEISVGLATGLMPWSFTWGALKQSFGNKLGHTRVEGERPVLDNFHVNHHQKHFKNFGFVSFPLDLLFGTELGDVSSLGNMTTPGVRCTKRVEAERYVLVIEPATNPVDAARFTASSTSDPVTVPA
jgi:hypothetical protein